MSLDYFNNIYNVEADLQNSCNCIDDNRQRGTKTTDSKYTQVSNI